jgi:hypothetical protein
MTRIAKLACPLAILAALCTASAPAKAQFGGIDDKQMEQFAPMLEMMKQKMGKERFGELMKTMGPMMEQMQGQGGLSGGSIDIGQIASMMGSMKGLMGAPPRTGRGKGKGRRPRG